MRKYEDAARRDQLCDLVRGNGEAPFAQAEQHERLQVEFG
jgi:hypothetical protein